MSQTSTREGVNRILVVGAGIAGLAAAIAVRSPGREVVVLESSGLKAEIGAAIHLAPNATRILGGWGIDMEKEAQATVCRQYIEMGIDGTIHAQKELDTQQAFGAPWLFQHRVDLHNALRKHAETDSPAGPAAVIECGVKVVEVDTDAGIVYAADGRKFEGDLIIGADGIHSKVRQSMFGEEDYARPSGHSAYRCLIPREDLQDIPEVDQILSVDKSTMVICVGGNRRTVMYPCRRATVLNIVAVVPDDKLHEQSHESWKAEGTTEDLVAAYEGFPAWITKTLSRAKTPGLYQLRDQGVLKTWVKGRAIIIGDAAHAMLPHQGQGAGQSVEDAEAIGTLLEDFQGQASTEKVEALLRIVFDNRIERASLIQAYSRDQALPVDASKKVKLNAMEFAGYNMGYKGIKAWMSREKGTSGGGGAPKAVAA